MNFIDKRTVRKYQVVVGNIGTVYEGEDGDRAGELYSIYKNMSRNGVGRGAGEDVTLLEDGEITHAYAGELTAK